MLRFNYVRQLVFCIFTAILLGGNVALADPPKPKAYVITGWNEGADDKAAHDAIADQAKKNLEAAGYDVTQITEATAEQIKNAIKDPAGQALVFIDHGATSEERIVGKKNGAKDRVFGSDFSGTFENYKAVTIHACGQNQESWKNKFPKADFFSWTGCTFTKDELAWEKNKKYADAQTPGGAKQEDIELSPLLTNGNFQDVDGDAVPVDSLFGGNWLMDNALATQFGSHRYNFEVRNQYTNLDEILFNADISNGHMVGFSIDDYAPTADFNFIMTYDQYIKALRDPTVLFAANLLNQSIFIQNLTSNPLDEQSIFSGIRRNVFAVAIPIASSLWLLMLGGLGLIWFVFCPEHGGRGMQPRA